MLFWVAVAYAISTPLAIWIHLSTPQDDCLEERLRAKASDSLKSVSWLFNGVFAAYHLCWAIVIGPLVVGFFVIAFPPVFVYEVFWGEGLPGDQGGDAAKAKNAAIG